jgi:hypothetical protein
MCARPVDCDRAVMDEAIAVKHHRGPTMSSWSAPDPRVGGECCHWACVSSKVPLPTVELRRAI